MSARRHLTADDADNTDGREHEKHTIFIRALPVIRGHISTQRFGYSSNSTGSLCFSKRFSFYVTHGLTNHLGTR